MSYQNKCISKQKRAEQQKINEYNATKEAVNEAKWAARCKKQARRAGVER